MKKYILIAGLAVPVGVVLLLLAGPVMALTSWSIYHFLHRNIGNILIGIGIKNPNLQDGMIALFGIIYLWIVIDKKEEIMGVFT